MNSRSKVFTAVLASVSLAGLAVACTKGSGSVVKVSAQETMGLLRNDFAVLVDVREEDEVKQSGMATQAKWIPMSKIEANSLEWQEFLKAQPKEKQLVFYCAKGGRAGKAAELAAKEGFRTGNLGGFEDWTSAGLPTQPGP